jgi:hypothetical protein
MKAYSIRLTFTDRKFGPGQGRTINVVSGNPHTGIKKATREFWTSLSAKQRRDVRRDGLTVVLREIAVDNKPKA